MLLSIQFPFADLRQFIPEDLGRLKRPDWPLPRPDFEFVRSFGSIRIRKSGGIIGWVGENEICEAKKAFRFCDNLSTNLKYGSFGPVFRIPLRCVYRRLYFDGLCVGKFEVGIASKKNRKLRLSGESTERLLSHFLSLKINIRNPKGESITCELHKAYDQIIKLYLLSSTKTSFESEKLDNQLIQPGLPLLLLEHTDREDIRIPFWEKGIVQDEFSEWSVKSGFGLYYHLVPYKGINFRMWRIVIHKNYDIHWYDDARPLRLYLFRLNAEHECLKLVLKNILAGDILDFKRNAHKLDKLQFYLNKATKKIGRYESKSDKLIEEDIAELARASINNINPGQREALLDKLELLNIRPTVRRKLENYTKDWPHVNLNFIKVTQMGDVFQNINNSVIATRESIAKGVISIRKGGMKEIADAIEKLEHLIYETSEELLPLDKKDESESLLKGITEEVQKKNPDKSVLKSLGKSLLSIITVVKPIAEAGKAAIELIKTLWV